ncbi:MAG: protein phosphatase 2C domain-containing protein [Lamprobacter sp.]|uniref:PP2C family protein-serine/threonine phosphatase n=1 Tax=Lamprobacter sp. TaxID=3100796 RepID=UPI002B260EDD|nr:protein phosphatase 2C domain-containing protein [Lamprobacter sp.]MEA3640545.1 protein phosphatase 2C domain-containing protein [Lamprobacter sp.]
MPEANGFVFQSASTTHPGRVRSVNQDALIDLPERGVWAVADGVGGHQQGEAASQAVVSAIAEVATSAHPEGLVEAIRQGIIGVNQQLLQRAHELGPDALIASTVAVMVADTNHCICLWAGDSRVYGFRQGRLSRLTRDHSQVEELVERGLLSAQDALHHPEANIILRAVGRTQMLELDAVVYDLYDQDKYLLCTDGITKELDEQEIAAVLAKGSCHENCKQLLELALSRHCADNVAMIVVDARLQDAGDTTLRRMRQH